MSELHKEIITYLNTILKNELTAINQYFLHYRILKFQGYDKLAAKEYEESIDEMKHADMVAERILRIGGLPNFQDLGKIYIGETVEEMLQADLKMEQAAIPVFRNAIAVAEATLDFVTADLLHEILKSEEEHEHWLTIQLGLIANLGLQNYLQSQV